MQTYILIVVLIAIVAMGAFSSSVALPVQAGEVNPAHDADNGNGNEKNFGQCKQEARNDNACEAKK